MEYKGMIFDDHGGLVGGPTNLKIKPGAQICSLAPDIIMVIPPGIEPGFPAWEAGVLDR